ncbi:MAG: hypothetical protein ACW99G_03680 [Candidatus Thorarchaeota archaeon]|jgi:hypothetical protein
MYINEDVVHSLGIIGTVFFWCSVVSGVAIYDRWESEDKLSFSYCFKTIAWAFGVGIVFSSFACGVTEGFRWCGIEEKYITLSGFAVCLVIGLIFSVLLIFREFDCIDIGELTIVSFMLLVFVGVTGGATFALDSIGEKLEKEYRASNVEVAPTDPDWEKLIGDFEYSEENCGSEENYGWDF